MRMNRKRTGIWWVCGIALLLAGIWLILTLIDPGDRAASYPDLEQVQVDVGSVPDGFDLENQPYMGEPDAPVIIVEFADYKCPACKRWKDEVLTEIKKEYLDTGKAVFYYVDLPFLAPDSNLAALAGESLYQQKQEFFWTYFDLMMAHQGPKDEVWANKDFIMKLVKENIPDVNMKTFEQDLDKRKYIANVKRDFIIGENHQVDGTPSVFINGQAAEDISFEGITSIIDNL